MAKVNISIPDELLTQLDNFAEKNFLSRSGAITMMVNQFLTAQAMTEQMKNLSGAIRKASEQVPLTPEEESKLNAIELLLNGK